MTWPGTAAIGCRWPRTLGRQWIHRSPTILRPVPQGTRAFFVQNARRAPTIRSDSQVEGCCGSMDFQMGTVEAWRSLQSHCTVQHLAVAVSGDFWSLFLFHFCCLSSDQQLSGKKMTCDTSCDVRYRMCLPCKNKPAQGYYTATGWLNESCPYACPSGFPPMEVNPDCPLEQKLESKVSTLCCVSKEGWKLIHLMNRYE